MAVKVEIKSYEKERTKEIKAGLKNSMQKAGALVEAQAKKNVGGTSGPHPWRKSGRLVGSITHRIDESNNQIIAEVGTNVEYGKYLEFGTSHHPPYPWLYPAVEMSRERIKQILTGSRIIFE